MVIAVAANEFVAKTFRLRVGHVSTLDLGVLVNLLVGLVLVLVVVEVVEVDVVAEVAEKGQVVLRARHARRQISRIKANRIMMAKNQRWSKTSTVTSLLSSRLSAGVTWLANTVAARTAVSQGACGSGVLSKSIVPAWDSDHLAAARKFAEDGGLRSCGFLSLGSVVVACSNGRALMGKVSRSLLQLLHFGLPGSWLNFLGRGHGLV